MKSFSSLSKCSSSNNSSNFILFWKNTLFCFNKDFLWYFIHIWFIY